jgi:hypothetical protein
MCEPLHGPAALYMQYLTLWEVSTLSPLVEEKIEAVR